MRGKARFNYALFKNEALLGVLAAMGTVGGIGGGVYLAMTNDILGLDEKPRPRLYEYTTVANDPGTYGLRGPDQITTKQGDYTYTFNYEALQVLIEGEEELQPIDFRTFSNPAMIESVKDKGCAIATSFTAAADQYLAAGPHDERALEYIGKDRAIAQSYIIEHCPATRQAPHVR